MIELQSGIGTVNAPEVCKRAELEHDAKVAYAMTQAIEELPSVQATWITTISAVKWIERRASEILETMLRGEK